MNQQKRTKKNYTYCGLGFPILLEEVEVTTIEGEDFYGIDFQNLKHNFLVTLMTDPSVDFLGGMIKFVRQSLELSKEEMATRLGVTNSTVSEWETRTEEVIELTDFQKSKLKQDIKNSLTQEQNNESKESH